MRGAPRSQANIPEYQADFEWRGSTAAPSFSFAALLPNSHTQTGSDGASAVSRWYCVR